MLFECWLYFNIFQGGSGFWRSFGKQGWKVNWISLSETLLLQQDVVWYMLDVFLKGLTECSGGRATIVKNAFFFLSFLQFSFFQSIHPSLFCLYPFSVSEKISIYDVSPSSQTRLLLWGSECSEMTFWPQPVNSSHSYNWNHLHQGKMKRALLSASFLFTTCIISAGCTRQSIFFE